MALCGERFRALFVEFPSPEISVGQASIPIAPSQRARSSALQHRSLGNQVADPPSIGSANSWFRILWNSSGVTSKIMDG